MKPRLIYNQTTSGVTEGPRAPDDISLDHDTFELTVAHERVEEFSFLCRVTTPLTTYNDVIVTVVYSKCSNSTF